MLRPYWWRCSRTHHGVSLLVAVYADAMRCVPTTTNYLTTNLIFIFMSEAKKKGTWELVLKIIIAVASAIAGALGTAACQGRL